MLVSMLRPWGKEPVYFYLQIAKLILGTNIFPHEMLQPLYYVRGWVVVFF